MNNYIGDFKKGQTIRIKFNTFDQSMVPADASIAPQVVVYKNSTTEITTGITQPSANYDSKAGLYLLVIDTSGADYVVGDDYDVVFTQGTVDGVDLTRTILRTFSIENRNEDANVINIGGQSVSASATINFPADIASTTNITSASGVSLTAAYDSAKTAASQISVNAIPTNPLLTNDTRLNNLDATISSRLASGNVTVGGYASGQDPASLVWGATTRTLTAFGFSVTVGTNNDKTGYTLSQAFPANFSLLSVDANGKVLLQPAQTGVTIPTVTNLTNAVTVGTINANVITASSIATDAVTEIQTGLATSSALSAIDTKIDTIDNFIDTEIAAIKSTTDKLDTTVELDGLVYRFTTNSLEQAPVGGGGGGTDWTADERIVIRAVLGIPTTGTVPLDPSSGILDVIRDKIDVVDDFVDTEIAAIKTVVDAIEVDTQNIQSRIPAALVSGRMDSNVGSLTNNVITASSIAASALDNKGNWNVGKTGYALTQAFPTNFASMSIDVSGRLLLQPTQTGVTIPTVTNVSNGVIVTTNNDKTGYALTSVYDAAKTAATQTSVNSIPTNPLLTNDVRLNSLSNLDVTVSSRLASASYVSPDNSSILAIKSQTDQFVFTSGRVNSVINQVFPTNFAAMAIDAQGKLLLQALQTGVTIPTVTNVTSLQNTAYQSIADYVWDEPYSGHTTAGTFGKLMDIMKKANTLIEGTVTSATTPTNTTFSSTVNYPTGALEHTVLLWLTGTLAEQNSPIITYSNSNGQIVVEEAFTGIPSVGDQFVIAPLLHVHAISDIKSGLSLESTSQSILSNTSTILSRLTSAVYTTFQDLATMIQSSGTNLAKWTASALSLAPTGTGGGGSGNVTVNANILPIQSYMRKRVESETISLFFQEVTDVFITVEDENGPIDLTGKTLEFVVETKNKANLLVIANGDIGKSSTGVVVRINTTVTNNIGTYLWSLRDITSGDTVLSWGYAEVSYAPKS